VTRTHDVNMESTDGLLLIHDPTDDTLLSLELLKAMGYKSRIVQVGNSAATNTWQAHNLSYDLSARVSERLSQRLSHLHAHLYGTPSPM